MYAVGSPNHEVGASESHVISKACTYLPVRLWIARRAHAQRNNVTWVAEGGSTARALSRVTLRVSDPKF